MEHSVIRYSAKVQAMVIDPKTNEIKSSHTTNNSIVNIWEDFIVSLLAKSWPLALKKPYWTTQENFVDCMAVWAWVKINYNTWLKNKIKLPYLLSNYPTLDSNSYNWCVVHCTSWVNKWEFKNVVSYDVATNTLTTQEFTNVPTGWDIYLISTSKHDTQLHWEREPDNNWNVTYKSRQFVTSKIISNTPNTNEISFTAYRSERTWPYTIVEAWLFYNVPYDLDWQSSFGSPTWQKLFARCIFDEQNSSPIYKAAEDAVQIIWTIRINSER